MIQVKCPQCSTSLALKQAPASGKVKCPKCAAIVSVATSASSGAPVPKPSPAARPVAAKVSASTRDADDIDFRSIPIPTAPAPSGFFPVSGNAKIYDGPVALDPIPKQKSEADHEEEDEHPEADNQQKSKRGGKPNQAKVIGIIVGVVLLVAVGGGAAFMFMGGGDGGAPEVDLVAQAAAAAPSGYQAKSLHNCVVLMPAGTSGDNKIPGAIDAEIVQSDATESVFLLAAMDGGTLPIEPLQMKKKTNNSLGGEMLGGTDTERNGYKGIKGVQDQSPFLPRMSVEVFHHDGRFVIIGHVTGTQIRSSGGEAVVGGNSAEEAKEVEVFYNSFKIGPPQSGFFGN